MALPSSVIRSGTRAAQPLATAVAAGTLYWVEDEKVLERSSGSAWTAFSIPSVEDFILTGDRASQPDADTVETGSIYFVTDEEVIERSDGAAWQPFSGTGGGLGGCLAVLSNDLSGDFSSAVAIQWDGADVFDDSDYHDPTSDNTRLTAPATGIYLATCNINVSNLSANQFNRLRVVKNGENFPGQGQQITEVSSAVTIQQSVSCIVPMDVGDYLEAMYDVNSDTSVTILAANSGFAIYRLA